MKSQPIATVTSHTSQTSKPSMSREHLLYTSLGVSVTIEENGLRIAEQSNQHEHEHGPSYCCGIDSTTAPKDIPSFIPYKDILYSEPRPDPDELNHRSVSLTYVSFGSKTAHTRKIQIQFDDQDPRAPNATTAAQVVLSKAYEKSDGRKSILVLINPHGGKGEAVNIYKNKVLPILRAARAKFTYKETRYHGHATEIARDLNLDEYDVIACCSGDGVPHEVINGFHERPDKGVSAFNKIAVTQIPCGSGNALALSSFGSNDAAVCTVKLLKAQRSKLDLMAMTQFINGSETTKLSFLTQCYGSVADGDIGTENIRWMGPIRFELGVIHKIFIRQTYPCDLYVKWATEAKSDIVKHYEASSQNAITARRNETDVPILSPEDFSLKGPKLSEEPPKDWTLLPNHQSDKLSLVYAGKLPYISSDIQFFPAALPSDGAMDLILTDTNSSILDTLAVLTKTDQGQHVFLDNVNYHKISSYRLVPRSKTPTKHFLSVDGESFPFQTYQVEVIPQALTILLPGGKFVDTYYSKEFEKSL